MIQIALHQNVLEKLGLHTLDGVMGFDGTVIEKSKDRRDVLKIEVPRDGAGPLVLFLKRHWKCNRLQSLLSFPLRFRAESLARREWENGESLQAAGFETAPRVAFGDLCGVLGEKFSFLLTEAAPGSCNLEEFYQRTTAGTARRRVFDRLASEVSRLHASGMSMPDLFARHIFFSPESADLSFCFIDVARLTRRRALTRLQKAKCLAALNVSAPASLVSDAERLRFFRRYAGKRDRQLLALVVRLTQRLLRRRRYQKLQAVQRIEGREQKQHLPLETV